MRFCRLFALKVDALKSSAMNIVTTCNLAQEALDLLRERKDGFDIVISDVNMPDMDGFKLLEHVGLKMDLPVIMMSVDGETSRVMKGVQHGACDYLLKPIRMKELQNIWQHVFRKRLQEVRGIEGQSSLDETRMMRNGMEQSDDGHLFSGDMISGKKRKDLDSKNNDRECGDPSSVKKARVVWTVDLHQKFVKAVNQIGFDKVGPKKILDLMGEPRLTRENVASHLQKYRLYLSRLQKENELKAACGGIKLSDISSKDPSGNVCLQSAAEPKKPLFGDMTNCLISSTSRIGFNHSFELLNSEVKPESKIEAHHTWSTGVPSVQFKQEFKPHFQSCHTFEPIPCSMWSTRNHNLEQNLHDNLEFSLKNLVVGTGADLGYSSPGDLYPSNPHLVNLESFSYCNQELIADVRPHSYDLENFDCEYSSDPGEYLVMDQGLYIA